MTLFLKYTSNFDGYANSIYTLTIGSINSKDEWISDYSETCSSILTVTYSGPLGGIGGDGIFTTQAGSQLCSDKHGGTSASVPLASGVIALALSIRPDLTWRDIFYLIMISSQPIQLSDASWFKTFQNRLYSIKYGYGKIDAFVLIENVKKHRLLSPFVEWDSPLQIVNSSIPQDQNGLSLSIEIHPENIIQSGLKTIEQVSVTLDLSHQRRGDVYLDLESPKGIVSPILEGRPYDYSAKGFQNWTVSSVIHW